MNAITFSDYLIVKPYIPKNPFTNVEFSHSNLYAISNKLIRFLNVNTLIYSFKECAFDIRKYTIENKIKLQELSIIHYIKKLDKRILFHKLSNLIFTVIRYRCFENRIPVEKRDEMIEIGMKSLIYYYYKYYYGHTEKFNNHINVVRSNLFRIVELNPFYFKQAVYKKYRVAKKHNNDDDSDNNNDNDSDEESEVEFDSETETDSSYDDDIDITL